MEIVDVAEPDVDLQSVLLCSVIWRKEVRFVGLWRRLIARNLNQLGRFDQHRELSIACSYSYRIKAHS